MTRQYSLIPMIILGAMALGGIIWSASNASSLLQWVQVSSSKEVVRTSSGAFVAPASAQQADWENFGEFLAKGGSLPSGFSIEAYHGTVKGTLTGLRWQPTGERQFILSVHDEAVDLDTATVKLDDQAVATATIANGGVVVRDDIALATMTFLLPATPPYTLQVDWSGPSQEPRSFFSHIVSE